MFNAAHGDWEEVYARRRVKGVTAHPFFMPKTRVETVSNSDLRHCAATASQADEHHEACDRSP
jgi:hypothetical protein